MRRLGLSFQVHLPVLVHEEHRLVVVPPLRDMTGDYELSSFPKFFRLYGISKAVAQERQSPRQPALWRTIQTPTSKA